MPPQNENVRLSSEAIGKGILLSSGHVFRTLTDDAARRHFLRTKYPSMGAIQVNRLLESMRSAHRAAELMNLQPESTIHGNRGPRDPTIPTGDRYAYTIETVVHGLRINPRTGNAEETSGGHIDVHYSAVPLTQSDLYDWALLNVEPGITGGRPGSPGINLITSTVTVNVLAVSRKALPNE